ncbi:MAG: helix-hairpin-helix domain-containing protein [Lachnospiraceae bacterium]|nr:helix-hairpin-helix domain-containing protein [Lachnospiraceae bacterium]
MNRIKIVMCGILFLLCAGCAKNPSVYLEESEGDMRQTEQVLSTESDAEDIGVNTYYVYVCGAVKTPGVYALPAGSRIYEALEMAGGLKDSACAESIHQAEPVTDGQTIQVPTYDEVRKKEIAAAKEEDGKININSAEREELMTLPGIGESKANSILSYRKEHGAFNSIEELKNITGIKEGVYSKIKDYITVD